MTSDNSKVIASAMQSKKRSTKKLTTAEFIARAKAIHGDKYNYHLVHYINISTKVSIVCGDHGVFPQRPSDHLKGAGCPKCKGAKNSVRLRKGLDFYLAKFMSVHGENYDYSLIVNIETSKQKLPIICPIHGVFEQSANIHSRGYGCWDCGIKQRANAQTKKSEKAIDDFRITHGDRYLYDRAVYTGKKNDVIIGCKLHGYFTQNANRHQQGAGCPECAKEQIAEFHRYNKSNLIEKFHSTHNGRYAYIVDGYKNQNSIIRIECKEHGWFKQRAANHLAGHGCLKCGLLSTAIKKDYIKICNKYDGQSSLYVVRMFLKGESFFKVGIAREGARKRFKDKTRTPYNFEILMEYSDRAEIIWDLEKRIHKMCKNSHYTPTRYFKGGKTECFSVIPKEAYKLIEDLQKSHQLQLIT